MRFPDSCHTVILACVRCAAGGGLRQRVPWLLAAFVALTATLLTGCRSGSSHNTLPATVTSIIVGYSYTGSGPDADTCRGQRAGYELWAATVNKAGGVTAGKRRLPVHLVGYDDGGNAAQAAQNAERLVLQDGANVLLGPCDPATSLAVATVAARYQRLLIVTAPFADQTLAREYPTVVDVAPTAARDALPAVTMLAGQSPRPRLAVLWADDQPAQAIGQAAVTAAQHGGLTVDVTGVYPTGAMSFGDQVARIQSGGDAAVLIAGHPAEAAALRAALASAGAAPRVFIVAPEDGWESVVPTLGAAGEGAYVLAPWPGALAAPAEPLFGSPATFAAAFRAANGYPPTAPAALATAGGEALDAAIAGSGAIDGAALRGWFNHGGTTATVAGSLPIAADAGASSLQRIVGGALVPVNAPAAPSPAGTPVPTPFATPIAAPPRRATPGG